MPVDHLFCNHFSRKVVLEKWFCKLGFFFWSTTFLQPEKRWIYGIKPPFFSDQLLFSNQISRTTFLEPLFQKSGCRLNGRLGVRGPWVRASLHNQPFDRQVLFPAQELSNISTELSLNDNGSFLVNTKEKSDQFEFCFLLNSKCPLLLP